MEPCSGAKIQVPTRSIRLFPKPPSQRPCMHELSEIDENIDETDLQKLMNGRWIDIHGGPSKLVFATQHQLLSFDSMIGQDETNWKEGSSFKI